MLFDKIAGMVCTKILSYGYNTPKLEFQNLFKYGNTGIYTCKAYNNNQWVYEHPKNQKAYYAPRVQSLHENLILKNLSSQIKL